MKKSNIVLAILAGAAIGGILAIILKAENAVLNYIEDEGQDSSFENISRQFSEKFSSEFKTAENKIKSAVTDKEFSKHDEEGVFL